MAVKNTSALAYLLKALIPYSKANLQLSFKPNTFFNELEKVSHKKRSSLQSTLSSAIRIGLVERHGGIPILTAKGQELIKPLMPNKLQKDVSLMVIFDIPEVLARKRRYLRRYLRLREFKIVQKSVWLSPLDYSAELRQVVQSLQLEPYVQVFESARIKL
jgi:hypothetical protein